MTDARPENRRVADSLPIPGGIARSSLLVGPPVHRAVRGSGCYVVDQSGRALLDLNNNFTTLVHGHRHPAIHAATVAALEDGVCFGMPNRVEMEHAEVLAARFPHAEQVVYTNSGTEAAMLAIRVARARTRRSKVVFVAGAYHGTSDIALAAAGYGTESGVPAGVLEDLVTVPHNDVDALARMMSQGGGSVAAVVLDLLPNKAGLMQLSQTFVAAARELTAKHGALLIVDEVISFRFSHAGLQARYDAVPDLTVLGKLIGGGFPVGAVVGSADAMEPLDPFAPAAVEHGGTFSGNPVTMCAGIASLQLLDGAAIERLNSMGDQVRAELEPAANELGWELRGLGSVLRLLPPAGEPDPAGRTRALWWAAYDRGCLLMPTGMLSLSTVMHDETVADIVATLVAALDDVHSAPQTVASIPARSRIDAII